MRNLLNAYSLLSSEIKKTTFFLFITYFFVIFSYPLVRSATGSLFYEAYTDQEYSLASFIGVMALMLIIFINNKFQQKLGIHKIFILTGLLTISGLGASYFLFQSGIKEMAFVLFAIKESYIVLLIHIALAFSNSYYDLITFKKIIGPLGAIGSIGGILGGQITSYLAKNSEFGTEYVLYVSLVIIFLSIILFYQTRFAIIKEQETNKSITPLKAIHDVRKYVYLIAAIVGVSQFVIFIADLQFNMVFVKAVTEKNARTAFLGDFYSKINAVSLVLQFFVLPFLLTRVKTKNIFLFIPVFYMILIIGGLGYGAGQIFIVGWVFILMKGVDYSLFSVAKEVMYHPLLSLQKYGAKYLTDMFVYRVAKASIAFVMAQSFIKIYTSDMRVLTVLQFVFLTIWILLIFKLFHEEKKLK